MISLHDSTCLLIISIILVAFQSCRNNGQKAINYTADNSEWVSPGIVRGGSWKSESISARQVIDLNSQEPNIGFRIVQSYITVQK